MSIGIVGAGRWGENLIRNFFQLGVLTQVCDANAQTLKSLANKYPTVKVTSDFEDLLKDPNIEGIVIATPAHTHEKLAKLSLNAGKHVYVEKPLARNTKEAESLIELANSKGLTLMVGHLLLYHPAVNQLKQLIAQGELGEIRFLNSDRRNLSVLHRDTNVMWDLAPHDISMISYLLGIDNIKLDKASGYCTSGDKVIDVVHLDLMFDNIHAHIHNSWIDPQKQALLTINGSLKTAVLNDVMAEQKLELYSIDVFTGQVIKECPIYPKQEPLRLECQHFIDSIKSGEKPLSDGISGYKVVEVLEEADRYMPLTK